MKQCAGMLSIWLLLVVIPLQASAATSGITTRASKGAPLTYGEMDANFITLRDAADGYAGSLMASIAALNSGARSGTIGFLTYTALAANLGYAEGTLAMVTNDPATTNNNYWIKVGSTGSGYWQKSSMSPALPLIDCRQYTDFGLAVVAQGPTPALLVVTTAMPVPTDVTVPDTLELMVTPSGSFTGAGKITNLKRAQPEWFGSKGDGVTDDSSAIKKSLASVRAGGTVSLSNAPVSYKFDNSGGLTSAAVIDKAITLKIDSTVVGTTGGAASPPYISNPPYLFNITADDVLVTGKGTMKNSGLVDDTNSGTTQTTPGMIYVTGNKARISGLTFDAPPKTGIMLYNSTDSIVEDCKFIGGVPVYGGTSLFGIDIYGGARHKILNNYAGPDATGKKIVTLVFSSGGATGNLISGNHGNGIYEKICYLYGSDNIISNNYIIGPTLTAPYRVHGSGNKITNNRSINCYGGAQITDGQNNSVIGNTFTGCVQGGISVFVSTDYFGPLSGTKIDNNIVTGTGVLSSVTQDGISIVADTADAANISISGNTISGFRNQLINNNQSAIRLQGIFPYKIRNSKITNNIIDSGVGNINSGGTLGITAIFNDGGDISANSLTNQKTFGFNITSSTNMMVRGNTVRDVLGVAWGANNGTNSTAFINNRSINSGIGISGLVPGVSPLSAITKGTVTALTTTGHFVVTNNTEIILNGFAGADANLLNGQRLMASNLVIGTNNDTFTVAVDTTEKDITLGAATVTQGLENYGTGNQYTSAPLTGKVTVGAVPISIVKHGGIAPNAVIVVSPASASTALSVGSRTVFTGISNNDFAITTGNGSAWAGTETFNWQVVQ